MRNLVAVCGTLGGHSRHRRLGEKPCQACRLAARKHRQARFGITARIPEAPPLPRFGEDAHCRQYDPGFFFPEKGERNTEAKAICVGCAYQIECLTYAVAFDLEGIWGGTSREERQRIRRKAGIVAIPLLFGEDIG